MHYPQPKIYQKSPKDPKSILILTMKLLYEVESTNSSIIMVGTALSALRAVSTMHSQTTDCKDLVIACVGHCTRTV